MTRIVENRTPRSEALIAANLILSRLGECATVSRCEIAGSLRRGASTCGDIDIVAAAVNRDDALREISSTLHDRAEIKKVKIIPDVGYKLVLSSYHGFQIRSEIWIVAPSHYGSTLNWTTGSRKHNRDVRLWCWLRGYKLPIGRHRLDMRPRFWWLNREAFFIYVFRPEPASENLESEEEFYDRIELDWVPPSSREGGLKAIWKAHQRWRAKSRSLKVGQKRARQARESVFKVQG